MAHEPFQRFERVAHDPLDNLSRTAAIVVATLAVFLAIAMFLLIPSFLILRRTQSTTSPAAH